MTGMWNGGPLLNGVPPRPRELVASDDHGAARHAGHPDDQGILIPVVEQILPPSLEPVVDQDELHGWLRQAHRKLLARVRQRRKLLK
jgi:hypothetical protein